jgi:hypothetical protein
VWGLLPGVPDDDNNWSAGDVTADGAVLYLATSDGGLSIVDSRNSSSSSGGNTVIIANRKVRRRSRQARSFQPVLLPV